MYYILPVSHDMQCLKDDCIQAATKFKMLLRVLCGLLSTTCIAEEYSEDAEKKCKCKEVSCREVTAILNISHIFCDPGSKEREALGISDVEELDMRFAVGALTKSCYLSQLAKNFKVREEFWLTTIQTNCSKHSNIIVVIGDNHKVSFSSLLTRRKIKFKALPMADTKTIHKYIIPLN